MPSKSSILGWGFLNAKSLLCSIVLKIHFYKVCGIPSMYMEQGWCPRCWSLCPSVLKGASLCCLGVLVPE